MPVVPLIFVKIAIPFLSAAAVGGVKWALAHYGHQIPSWLKPLLAAVVGAMAGGLAGDPSALLEAAAEGAALGGGAPAVREVYRTVIPEDDPQAPLRPAGI